MRDNPDTGIAAHESDLTSPSGLGDTIRMPGPLEIPIVRPALAMLYRLAVGPNPDHYASRFLAFEKAGKPLAGWNWAAFFAPCLWAAYRKLWIAALVFALLPLGGAMAFVAVSGTVDRALGAWAVFALLLIWLLPCTIAAACADYLVYRRVRAQSLAAERETVSPVEAATRAATSGAVSWYGAAGAVAGVTLIAVAVSHDLVRAWHEHHVRQQVIATLAAVRGLEQEVEATWLTARLVPSQTDAVSSNRVATSVVEDVNVSPDNGRLRVRFGPSLPELEGKAILLAPVRTAKQHVRWLCIPIDIPPEYLPPECRRR
ncbi:MAG: DUF2628 domain-containing protein [Pseudomonadota bacterium]|nr:DUF2628 domain-containing protein [Pseudomonadota bacterium]